MVVMHCNFTKVHVFPLVSRVSGCSKCFDSSRKIKSGCFSDGWGKSKRIDRMSYVSIRYGLEIDHDSLNMTNMTLSYQKTVGKKDGLRLGFNQKTLYSNGFHKKEDAFMGVGSRSYCNGFCENHIQSGRDRQKKDLPWISKYRRKESQELDAKSREFSWEDSAKNYFSRSLGSSLEEDKVDCLRNDQSNEEKARNDVVNRRMGKIHLENGNKIDRYRKPGSKTDIKRMGVKDENRFEEEVADYDEDEDEDKNDPRWDKINSKLKRYPDRVNSFERPEVLKWNKQEAWGKKTWKEATSSSIPKMIGEGIYGVSPVLAALTVKRREFYTLYVQEGLDLSGNNKKKKDKKGVEKILKIAQTIGLTIKETSKHDLNMIVDNRPHQGFVLDASQLDMISARELEPISSDESYCPLWVALDEVTDPQNLGAIIRSAYYFGVTGVVMCAKNSAPLSGVVSKASAGSLELIELRYCKNMMHFLNSSSENGWRVLGGSVSSKAIPLNEIRTNVPTILVLGSEGMGLRPLVERSCTHLVRIPGFNFNESAEVNKNEGDGMDTKYSGSEVQNFLAVESLNVSVAAGVLLYHLVGNNGRFSNNKPVDPLVIE